MAVRSESYVLFILNSRVHMVQYIISSQLPKHIDTIDAYCQCVNLTACVNVFFSHRQNVVYLSKLYCNIKLKTKQVMFIVVKMLILLTNIKHDIDDGL